MTTVAFVDCTDNGGSPRLSDSCVVAVVLVVVMEMITSLPEVGPSDLTLATCAMRKSS